MSDMMSTSSVQASEKKPWMDDRVTDANETIAPNGSIIPLTWTTVTIDNSVNPSTISCTGGTPSFSGTSSSSSSSNLQIFTNGGVSVYVLSVSSSNIDYDLLIYFSATSTPESPTTGVWMGTSSGGSHPCQHLVKA